MAEDIIIPEDCEIVTKGHTSNIYLVSDDVAAKVCNLGTPARFCFEYRIQKELFDAGYPVPKPFGKRPLYVGHDWELPMIFSMERVHGKDLEDITEDKESLMEEAENILKDINKNMGICIPIWYGLNERNVMFDERENRVTLIDFGHWCYL